MGKKDQVTTKTYVNLIKDWHKDMKEFKKSLSKDEQTQKDVIEKCKKSTGKLLNFSETNKEKLLQENPKNNAKTYNAMIEDIKRFANYLKAQEKIFKTVDNKVKFEEETKDE